MAIESVAVRGTGSPSPVFALCEGNAVACYDQRAAAPRIAAASCGPDKLYCVAADNSGDLLASGASRQLYLFDQRKWQSRALMSSALKYECAQLKYLESGQWVLTGVDSEVRWAGFTQRSKESGPLFHADSHWTGVDVAPCSSVEHGTQLFFGTTDKGSLFTAML
eukprot:TRINITY_DN17566_c0_g1_i1.p2 TRINITY_DN17566_c0_g1~~TRINITY_DN17566_c0_g1_i1.p2  ORF type:complete len:165 (-),score=26.27 TRINITY_DN17566_c0_g1_i1:8-502(-)